MRTYVELRPLGPDMHPKPFTQVEGFSHEWWSDPTWAPTPDFRFFAVLEDGREIARLEVQTGKLEVVYLDAPHREYRFITLLEVARDRRREGVATEMVRWLTDQEGPVLGALARTDDDASAGFWTSLGWTPSPAAAGDALPALWLPPEE